MGFLYGIECVITFREKDWKQVPGIQVPTIHRPEEEEK